MVSRQNEFGDKAAFPLALRVPAGTDTVSVGRMVSKRPGPDCSESHTWKAPRQYSAYLYGFAVGQFRQIQRTGRIVHAYVERTFV